jgi:hypothetical protein
MLIPAEQNAGMLQAATKDATAPCPRCQKDMTLAVAIPHPVAPLLARHTYLCVNCNQTRSYFLPVDASAEVEDADGSADTAVAAQALRPEDRRRDPREAQSAPATVYDKGGNFLLPCVVRDLSRSGARLELFKEAALPQYIRVSLLPDGGGRRLCSKVWQVGLVAGVRFVEQ